MKVKKLPLSQINSPSIICKVVGVDLSQLETLITTKQKYYKEETRKIHGKNRLLQIPSGKIKIAQSKLKAYLSKKITWPSFMQGGIQNKSTKTNGLLHIKRKYLLNLDIENYYPSIKEETITDALIKNGCERESAQLISKLATYKGILPQGTPTSTFLGNLVFLPIGHKINNICQKHDFTFSSYIDDISISGDKPVYHLIGTITAYLRKGGFSLSSRKTKIFKKNEAKIVNGNVVNDKIHPVKGYFTLLKREIRTAWQKKGLKDLAKKYEKSESQMLKNLWGRINYVKTYDKKKYREIRGLMTKVSLAK